MQKTILAKLGSKSTSGKTEFSENLIASRVTLQLFLNLLVTLLFFLGLHCIITERKIKEISASFQPETRLNWET